MEIAQIGIELDTTLVARKSLMKGFFGGILSLIVCMVMLPEFALGQSSFEATYGQAFTLNFHLVDTTGIDIKQDAVCATGDVVVMKDQNAEANSTNCFVDEGKGYSITFTAAELTASQTTVYIIDQTSPKAWLDKVIHIQLSKTAPAGTAQAGCSAPCNTIQLATNASSTNDIYNNNFAVAIIAGTGSSQVQCITDYVGSTRTATVAQNWVTAPDNSSQYMMLYSPNCSATLGAGSITSTTLDSSATTAIVNAIFSKEVEPRGGVTFQNFLKYAGAVLFGYSDDNGYTFRSPDDTQDRVVTTVDVNKNRTSVTLNPN